MGRINKRLQRTRLNARLLKVEARIGGNRSLLKHSAAEPQPKDDRIGFAACCEDAALPFRKRSAPFDFGLRPDMLSNRRAKPKS